MSIFLLLRSPLPSASHGLFDGAVQNFHADARVVTDQTSDDRAVCAEHYGLRDAVRGRAAVEETINLRWGEDGLVIHPKVSNEFLDRQLVLHRVFQVQPDHDQPVFAILFVQRFEVWNLHPAGSAPGGPEIEQNRFAFAEQTVETDAFAVERRDGEALRLELIESRQRGLLLLLR